MSIVAIARGLGDMGRLITAALVESGKHEVWVMSRRVPERVDTLTSPITGDSYSPIIQTSYSSVAEVAQLLEKHRIHTVICAFALDFEAASNSQLTLIKAADQAYTVERFLPSEFNIDYDLDDSVLPYPDKRLHTIARRELEKTQTLEYAYLYPGMFSDYFAMPNIETHLRALCVVLDAASGVAAVPGDGESVVSMSYTRDVARYTALALGLRRWPRVMTMATDHITLNELVRITERNLGRKLQVTYQSVESLRRHETTVLPRNVPLADHFPEGLPQLKALTSDLEASMALGAYDFTKLGEHLDLVKEFEGIGVSPMRIEKLLELAWMGR